MGLPNLVYPPPGDAGWQEYWFQHFQDHLEIMQGIQEQQNVKLTEYSIDPWTDADKDGILGRHQQYHDDMNARLGLSGSDLSELSFKSEDQLKQWVYLNYQEHRNARSTLGI